VLSQPTVCKGNSPNCHISKDLNPEVLLLQLIKV